MILAYKIKKKIGPAKSQANPKTTIANIIIQKSKIVKGR